ncbi:MAG TPA: hypothetical protein VNL98_08360, partial [Gemmatimonadales bacterium]|nr:hypothetical protein [Gemmatimonadales bacterium]
GTGLGVGKRFSFDPWRSRAWVICPRCARWNLTPFDQRLETIAALEKLASTGRVAATTDQVALIRVGPCDVVRVGKPPRTEFASWRYGERIKARERERLKVIVPVSIVVVGGMVAFNAAVGGSMGVMVGQVPGMIEGIYRWTAGNRTVRLVEPPICASCGTVMKLKARHLLHARLTYGTQADLALLVSCPRCGDVGAQLEGPDAEQALRTGLVFTNLKKGKKLKKLAVEAASAVDHAGGPHELIRAEARHERKLVQLAGPQALALEIAVDEQAELRELERQWREAEEIANIADGLLVDPAIEQKLRDLKARPRPEQT